jgi:hypothetical protein
MNSIICKEEYEEYLELKQVDSSWVNAERAMIKRFERLIKKTTGYDCDLCIHLQIANDGCIQCQHGIRNGFEFNKELLK